MHDSSTFKVFVVVWNYKQQKTEFIFEKILVFPPLDKYRLVGLNTMMFFLLPVPATTNNVSLPISHDLGQPVEKAKNIAV